MGPGPRGPGNNSAGAQSRRIRKLQWGRDRAVPEMSEWAEIARAQSVLQWGRDRAVPEMKGAEEEEIRQ